MDSAHPHYFFSIIIPAHNEERYIDDAIDRLRDLAYPREKYEIIVVENGSTDATRAVAKTHLKGHGKLITSPKGVSAARNTGMRAASSASDWIIFLDAGIRVAPSFLHELDEYLHATEKEGLSIGVTSFLPLGRTDFFARTWFAAHNAIRQRSFTPWGVIIMRADLRGKVRFNEHMQRHEDIMLMREARQHGPVFFFSTKTLSKSTRRVDHVGWWMIIFEWFWQSAVKQHLPGGNDSYPVVR